MELKKYQKEVLNDLDDFLLEFIAAGSASRAFENYWQGRSPNPGYHYRDSLNGVPSVCIKVPTGGGKTFIACNALKTIQNALPISIGRPVLWFVPSLAILDQTARAFRTPDHPYRQKLNALFSGRVCIFDKGEALTGAGFDPDTIKRQLAIVVVSYDSFRSATKEGRKVYQENATLAAFAANFGTGTPIENADDTSLAQTLNALRPLIVVDESHNAKSVLSLEMLRNLNPSFVLELTATPREESNIIASVSAEKLKKEQMVKLPVIVYNTRDVNEVVRAAIDLRQRLEYSASAELQKGAPRIRPIALFQAEPKNVQNREEEIATFGRIKEKLIGFGIPQDQIAIKTADINELKNVDLLHEKCKIRFIITINALKEGWDCPFAYVLASLANRSSAVDVEQIVGRILRQPFVKRSAQPFLNLSYVLTASDRFYETLQNIVKGLNHCGYTDREIRVKSDQTVGQAAELPESSSHQQGDFLVELDASKNIDVPQRNDGEAPGDTQPSPKAAPIDDIMSLAAASVADAASVSDVAGAPIESDVLGPDSKRMRPEFVDATKDLLLPSFYIREDAGLFNDAEGAEKKLTRQDLVKGFKLNNQDINLDFRPTELDLFEVDVRTDKRGFSSPEYTRMTEERSRDFAKLVSHLSEADRKRELFAVLYGVLKRFDEIPEKDIRAYIGRVIDSQTVSRLEDIIQNPYQYADLLKLKIISLMTEHAIDSFKKRSMENSLLTRGSWRFPRIIEAPRAVEGIRRSLYEGEAEVNSFELEIANEIAGFENVLFWHRNIERKGFFLNGYLNHYPDFLVLTKRRNVLIVESKGDDRNNTDSAQKLRLGQEWEKKAGESFKYFMVFQTIHVEGAFAKNQLAGIVAHL